MCVHAQLLQSCATLCDPMDCSSPGSSNQGILQARILEWVAIPFYLRSTVKGIAIKWGMPVMIITIIKSNWWDLSSSEEFWGLYFLWVEFLSSLHISPGDKILLLWLLFVLADYTIKPKGIKVHFQTPGQSISLHCYFVILWFPD